MIFKIKIIIIFCIIFYFAYAQVALPVFHAIQQNRDLAHPGFSSGTLDFNNDDDNNNGNGANGSGGKHVQIPWGATLKDFTVDDSTSFTTTIRCKLPSGSHYIRDNGYYSSPVHTIRGAWYHDGATRLYSALYDTSGAIHFDQERNLVTRSNTDANHSHTWSGRHSQNIVAINTSGLSSQNGYYFWPGDRGAVDTTSGVFTSDENGQKVWVYRNRRYTESSYNQVFNGNYDSNPTVLIENSAGGDYDYAKVTYTSLANMRTGESGTMVSTGLGSQSVGSGSDYGPSSSESRGCITFYKNGVYVLSLGIESSVTGSTTGTGYLGKNVYGADETSYVRLINVTEYAFMSFCIPSDIESLHNIQGSSDIRDWAPGRGKTIGLYYSLNNTVNDGDTVTDLSGRGHHGTAVGF